LKKPLVGSILKVNSVVVDEPVFMVNDKIFEVVLWPSHPVANPVTSPALAEY
jgi:hypothetical protein